VGEAVLNVPPPAINTLPVGSKVAVCSCSSGHGQNLAALADDQTSFEGW